MINVSQVTNQNARMISEGSCVTNASLLQSSKEKRAF